MEVVTPDSSSCVFALSIMNPGNITEGQGIYSGYKASAVHPAATLKPQ